MTEQEKLRRLERALEQAGNTHTVADVVSMVHTGRAQWWSWEDGHIVTEIDEFPQLKAANYFLVFGELKACLALQHDIDPWAIENGCSIATSCGRPGWLRAARASGWRLHGYAYTKRLTNG